MLVVPLGGFRFSKSSSFFFLEVSGSGHGRASFDLKRLESFTKIADFDMGPTASTRTDCPGWMRFRMEAPVCVLWEENTHTHTDGLSKAVGGQSTRLWLVWLHPATLWELPS